MKKLSLLFALLVSAAILLTACGSEPATADTAAPSTQPGTLIAEGRLLPVNSMDQAFARAGQVAEVLVENGDLVTQGQALARLSASPEAQLALVRAEQEALTAQQALDSLQSAAQVNLAQAKLAVPTAQDQLKAAQDLYAEDASEMNKAKVDAAQALLQQAEDTLSKLESGTGIAPDQQAAAEARLASANAALDSAQAAIDSLELKASMGGTVIDLTLQAGQWVAAGQPLITLADLSTWVVKTDNLTEYEVVDVAVGQKVQIALDALNGLTLSGKVIQINTRYEEKRGDITYTVTVALDQSDPALRWGMTATVQFVP